MKITHTAIAAALGLAFCGAAFAQAGTVQRDVNQQQRIEQGLQSGQLTTKEASKLEREESRVERDQSRAMQDGKLTPAEKSRLAREQNQVSRDIYRDKHNAQTGNPNSASSQRMQADVQRNINQQQRIEQGVKSGSLTNKETARLERGESKINRMEARAGADNNVNAKEQRRIQKAENRESRRIHKEKHDAQTK
ncbi:MAG TPA: hypothetical protein VLI89_12510 [Burkholderiales bacterium]|nr:hypothetical protein [Burkholderiales bacterium]